MNDLGKTVALVTYVGAANWDSTDAQRAELKRMVVPLLDTFRENGDVKPILVAVRSVMGKEWKPTGEWAIQLHSLGLGKLCE